MIMNLIPPSSNIIIMEEVYCNCCHYEDDELVGIFNIFNYRSLDGKKNDHDVNFYDLDAYLLSARDPKRGVSDYHQRRMFAHGYHFIAQQVTHP